MRLQVLRLHGQDRGGRQWLDEEEEEEEEGGSFGGRNRRGGRQVQD